MPCNRTRLDIRIDLVVLGSCHPRPMAPVKILFVGDARGDVPSLVKKLEAVNKKSGPGTATEVRPPVADLLLGGRWVSTRMRHAGLLVLC